MVVNALFRDSDRSISSGAATHTQSAISANDDSRDTCAVSRRSVLCADSAEAGRPAVAAIAPGDTSGTPSSTGGLCVGNGKKIHHRSKGRGSGGCGTAVASIATSTLETKTHATTIPAIAAGTASGIGIVRCFGSVAELVCSSGGVSTDRAVAAGTGNGARRDAAAAVAAGATGAGGGVGQVI